ncbi:hypothetical protein [Escherichia coli]|uniref:hypothetical protein n=1 Tax=Escherichia coli TaxID=562 RepID=UPI0010CC7FCA|nr:hypothetical protein [Escherichia coli]GCR37815.1 hypothetical protein BvCmsHHNP013_00133 [Escherichia coli]HAF3617572.1 hypothetical protein [Salmonella enterica]
MGVKITGLDKMQKQLKEVERATEALNGSYDVRFDANDPSSIENAIQEAYSMVDERASGYATNPMCHERCNSDPHPTPEIRSRG